MALRRGVATSWRSRQEAAAEDIPRMRSAAYARALGAFELRCDALGTFER